MKKKGLLTTSGKVYWHFHLIGVGVIFTYQTQLMRLLVMCEFTGQVIEIKNMTDKVATSKRTQDKLLTEQMNEYMDQLDQTNIQRLKLKHDLKLMDKIDYAKIDKKLKSLSTKLYKPATRRKAVFTIIDEIIVHNDIVKVVFSFNYLINQDIHDDILYEYKEIRDNIAIRFNHKKLTYIFQ
jgi:hypothetical protein